MKAKRVPGLTPDTPLAEGLVLIVEVRAGELRRLGAAAAASGDEDALHDTRIAAKRLRYVLELSEPVFGPRAQTNAERARMLQDLLGELHDSDVLRARVRRHRRALRRSDVEWVLDGATGSPDVDPALAAQAPGRLRARGLATLDTWVRTQQLHLRGRFEREWGRLDRAGWPAGLAGELRAAVGETEKPHAGNSGAASLTR
jgi:hypothetical protein